MSLASENGYHTTRPESGAGQGRHPCGGHACQAIWQRPPGRSARSRGASIQAEDMVRRRGLVARLAQISPMDWATLFLAVGAALAAMILAR